MFKNYVWQWNKVIDPKVCDDVIEIYKNSLETEQGKIGTEDGPKQVKHIRNTSLTWLPTNHVLYEIIFNYCNYANMNAEWYFSLAGYQSNIQIGHYEVGGHYDWHIDSYAPDENGSQRKISIVLMLSDETSYEGGNLILSPKLSESESITTFKGKGSIIAFPSCLWHKVTPVISGERFAAVAWFSGPAYR